MPKNMEKYETYKQMHDDLNKAMRAGFYYQAVFIEYAIVEDRCKSALLCAGVKCVDSKGNDISLTKKINKLKSNAAFTAKYPRSRLTEELLDELIKWKRDRDELVHNLANITFNDEVLREITERGKRLIRTLSTRVDSVNKFHIKLHEAEKEASDKEERT